MWLVEPIATCGHGDRAWIELANEGRTADAAPIQHSHDRRRVFVKLLSYALKKASQQLDMEVDILSD